MGRTLRILGGGAARLVLGILAFVILAVVVLAADGCGGECCGLFAIILIVAPLTLVGGPVAGGYVAARRATPLDAITKQTSTPITPQQTTEDDPPTRASASPEARRPTYDDPPVRPPAHRRPSPARWGVWAAELAIAPLAWYWVGSDIDAESWQSSVGLNLLFTWPLLVAVGIVGMVRELRRGGSARWVGVTVLLICVLLAVWALTSID